MSETTSGGGIDERVLREAQFLPVAPKYYTIGATIFYVIFLALPCLIFAPFTFGLSLLGLVVPGALYFFTDWYYKKYYDHLSCTLTDRKLLIGRGVWSRTEQAVPLDKITDMQMNQGLIMRWLGLEAMKVETAGQTGGVGGALVGLVGIEDSREFRAAVLRQRDRVVGTQDRGDTPAAPAPSPGVGAESDEVLREIAATLARIEGHMKNPGG